MPNQDQELLAPMTLWALDCHPSLINLIVIKISQKIIPFTWCPARQSGTKSLASQQCQLNQVSNERETR
jgi:hypothetical protein